MSETSLSAEQLEMRDSVRKLALKEIPKFQNEKNYNLVPRELFGLFAELGLAGMTVSEEFGGLELTPGTNLIVVEEIAAVDCGSAIFLSVHNMVCGIIQRSANPAQKKKYLNSLASGKLLGAFCLTEPSAGSDAAALKTEAKADSSGFILNGEKCYITSAGFADLYLVFARTTPAGGKDGISAFLVEKGAAGMTISSPEKKMGAELSPIASINFSDCKVPQDALLGELNSGYRIALSGLAMGRLSIAACANGISRSAIELAHSHLTQRSQFGQKLIEFQGLQFMLADMKMLCEAARALTFSAANDYEADPKHSRNKINTSMAKCFASDSCMQIATDAVQLLGGAGYIKEYKVERLMRDAKMLQIVEGTNQIQRMLIAREMNR